MSLTEFDQELYDRNRRREGAVCSFLAAACAAASPAAPRPPYTSTGADGAFSGSAASARMSSTGRPVIWET